jgi:hypothetical protein
VTTPSVDKTESTCRFFKKIKYLVHYLVEVDLAKRSSLFSLVCSLHFLVFLFVRKNVLLTDRLVMYFHHCIHVDQLIYIPATPRLSSIPVQI